MEPNVSSPLANTAPAAPVLKLCPTCYKPVSLEYYFCPNCGTRLNEPPLSKSLASQAWLYVFSIILPMICYIFVTRWQGWKYYKSNDEKAKAIGLNAIVLLTLSTIITLWLGYVWTKEALQTSLTAINADMPPGI